MIPATYSETTCPIEGVPVPMDCLRTYFPLAVPVIDLYADTCAGKKAPPSPDVLQEIRNVYSECGNSIESAFIQLRGAFENCVIRPAITAGQLLRIQHVYTAMTSAWKLMNVHDAYSDRFFTNCLPLMLRELNAVTNTSVLTDHNSNYGVALPSVQQLLVYYNKINPREPFVEFFARNPALCLQHTDGSTRFIAMDMSELGKTLDLSDAFGPTTVKEGVDLDSLSSSNRGNSKVACLKLPHSVPSTFYNRVSPNYQIEIKQIQTLMGKTNKCALISSICKKNRSSKK